MGKAEGILCLPTFLELIKLSTFVNDPQQAFPSLSARGKETARKYAY
jgi:hypothetical protein